MENFVKGNKRTALTKSLVKSAKTRNSKLHVLPTKGKWGIKFEGSDRFYRVFSAKVTALRLAKEQAKLNGISIVIIHNLDGKISSVISYEK